MRKDVGPGHDSPRRHKDRNPEMGPDSLGDNVGKEGHDSENDGVDLDTGINTVVGKAQVNGQIIRNSVC